MGSLIQFTGNVGAELFTRQLKYSILGTLKHNYIAEETEEFPLGFVRAAKVGNPWFDACWSRDAGAYLRELALYGFIDEAAKIAHYLMTHVLPGPDGYFSFPKHFNGHEKAYGTEYDGHACVCIGLMELHGRLAGEPVKSEIEEFLLGAGSPVRKLLSRDGFALIPGTGEFGGGWGVIHDPKINVVQNSMLAAMLLCFSRFAAPFKPDDAAAASKLADRMLKALPYYMTAPDGGWIWALNTGSLTPMDMDAAPLARGTSNINAVAPALYDALGRGALADPVFVARCRKTAERTVTETPLRKRLYETYGMISFIYENDANSLAAHAGWLGYSDCYFAETAVLLGDRDALTKSLDWIAAATLYGGHPPSAPRGILDGLAELPDEPSRYWFAERNFAPDWKGDRNEGCGTLNLIHVAECMKLARVMAGVNRVEGVADSAYLPTGWSEVKLGEFVY